MVSWDGLAGRLGRVLFPVTDVLLRIFIRNFFYYSVDNEIGKHTPLCFNSVSDIYVARKSWEIPMVGCAADAFVSGMYGAVYGVF